ncbi:MAG: 6-phosphogluconolactonase [Thermoanaerobaculia bacterium]|nr:6-phosphogluconolactonase [Thermoanaerobaculia bacterium]
MNFRVFESVDDVVSGVVSTIVSIAEARDRAVISLSGGSTPEVVYRRLGTGDALARLSARRVIWVMGDERCVPPDDAMSNSRMVSRSLFADGLPEEHEFLRFRTELENPAKIAADFEDRWRALNIGTLDVALLGVGEDGHTASLFPGTDVLGVEDRIAKEVWVEKMNGWRVTLTMPVLRASQMRVVIANGAKKKPILTELRGGAHYPVAEAMRGGENAWWFVDRDAYPGEPA